MKSILKKRILDLGRGEDGVALVVTLAVFMFMYIFCAGVFAVGQMVKDRICLQNAADAAAYSAAVVQADTLSRIATINRAMSWTYAQMNKRRMDFIVYRWIEHARDHYRRDKSLAQDWVWTKKDCPNTHIGHGNWGISLMTLNGHFDASKYPEHNIDGDSYAYQKLMAFEGSHLSEQKPSLYNMGGKTGIEGLQRQIDADAAAIAEMNEKEEELMRKMPERIDTAAVGILRANVPDFDSCGYVIHQNRNPGDPDTGYLSVMTSSAENELRFLEWGNTDEQGRQTRDLKFSDEDFEAGNYDKIINDYFKTGSGSWFRRRGDGTPGFRRSYEYTKEYLKAEWKWWAWHCEGCFWTPPVVVNGIVRSAGYWTVTVHHRSEGCEDRIDGHKDERCRCERGIGGSQTFRVADLRNLAVYGRTISAFSYADNGKLCSKRGDHFVGKYIKYYEGSYTPREDIIADGELHRLRARPNVLKEDFFKGAGTITVGIARPNMNPWRNQYVLGKEDSNIGLYHAFDPFLDWMGCFSSARAGYKILHMPSKYESEPQEYKRWESSSRRIRIEQKPRIFNGERDYCIDWKGLQPVIRKLVKVKNKRGVAIHGQDWHWEPEWVKPPWRESWNLRQSDWDAVMIPVCRAASGAFEGTDYSRTYGYFREPCWGATDHYYLTKVIRNDENDWRGALGATVDTYQAGRLRPQAVSDVGYIDYAPGDLRGLVEALPNQYQGWNANVVRRGGTTAIKWPFQWRVSGFGQSLNWVELQRQMLH